MMTVNLFLCPILIVSVFFLFKSLIFIESQPFLVYQRTACVYQFSLFSSLCFCFIFTFIPIDISLTWTSKSNGFQYFHVSQDWMNSFSLKSGGFFLYAVLEHFCQTVSLTINNLNILTINLKTACFSCSEDICNNFYFYLFEGGHNW